MPVIPNNVYTWQRNSAFCGDQDSYAPGDLILVLEYNHTTTKAHAYLRYSPTCVRSTSQLIVARRNCCVNTRSKAAGTALL